MYQYLAKKPARNRLKYQFNASFSIYICTGRQNVFSMKTLGIKLHAFEFSVSILNKKDNRLLQLSGRFPDILQYGMQHSKIQLLQAITM